ncbi:MAG TPA: rRNA adenine N-6-methyltransferase family protein [Candidatus Paceibacterota bacterium]|nr:hypothetical protein [uncultured archaeon]
MNKYLNFIKIALSDKSKTGAIVRSSSYVVRAVLKLISGRPLQKIVEYGSGDGVMTLELLKHLSPQGRLLAVETDSDFVKILKQINDPRLLVIEDSMQNVSRNIEKYGFDSADLFISSVPFSYLSKSEREEICDLTRHSLASSGMFIIFHQYSNLMAKPLRMFFGWVKVGFEPLNFLPCFIISAMI